MKFTQLPTDAFKNIQINAGIVVDSFTPSTLVIGNILGATSGGVNATATPTYTDFGDDIDNCPKNMMELKKLESWEAKMSGSFVTCTAALAKQIIGAADLDTTDTTHVIPRNDIATTDFKDVWWIGDYSNVNDGTAAGYCAIHLKNSLSTGGFQIQSSDNGKGTFAFEFTGHYTMDDPETVPFEIYIKVGASA